MKPKIFISYRRNDSACHTGRLFDNLKYRYGEENLFMDTTSMPVWEELKNSIKSEIDRCKILIVVIGKNFARSEDDKFNYDILNDDDYVRFELEYALKNKKEIFPVLLGDAEMPNKDKLPESLHSIKDKHAFTIKNESWGSDFNRFFKKLSEHIDFKEGEPAGLKPFQKFLGEEIVSLIKELNQRNVKPRVHGVDLLTFEGNVMALVNFLQRYSPLKSLDDLRRVLYWKYNVENKGVPLCGISRQEANGLFRAVFDQPALQEKFQKSFKERGKKLNIVLFRRGRHLRYLTNLLKTHPFVSLKIIISATDDGESWYIPSRVLHTTGIPGAAKALLDLCDDRMVQEFLKHRISKQQAEDFSGILDKLISPTSNINLSDAAMILWEKGMRIPRKTRLELTRLLQHVHSVFEIAKDNNWSEKKLSYESIPLRNLLLLGAGFSKLDFNELKKLETDAREKYFKQKIDWQDAVEALYKLLKIKKDKNDKIHSEVIFPSQSPQHLVAIRRNGTIYFSEAPINYHDSDSPFLGLWLINKTVDQQYIEDFREACEFEVTPKYSEKEWEKKWDEEWDFGIEDDEKINEIKEQVKATTFKVDEDKAIYVAEEMMARRSSTDPAKESANSISQSARKWLQDADIILFSGKKLETNVGGALIVPGVGQNIKSSSALKIYLPNLQNATTSSTENLILKQLDSMNRYLSGQLLYKDLKVKAERSQKDPDRIKSYFDYILTEFPAWNQYLLGKLTETIEEPKKNPKADNHLWENDGKVSFLGIDSSQIYDSNFYSSVLLVETLFSLYEIKHAGIDLENGNLKKKTKPEAKFKIANAGRLMQATFIDDRPNWDKVSLGLFRNKEGKPNQKIESLIESLKKRANFYNIKKKGAFIFDVDMTILPSGSGANLDSYQYLAYLFMLLLRKGIRVAIISGNSEQKQMNRIYRAIRNEMKDDPSSFANLTFYVNGGGLKIKFNNHGRKYYDKQYNQQHQIEIDKVEHFIKTALKRAAREKFGLSSDECKKFQNDINQKITGYNFEHTSLDFPEEWELKWYTEEELEGITKAGYPMAYPWIEMRGWSCDSNGKNEKAASLAIRPLPDFEGKTPSGKKEIRNLRANVIKELPDPLGEYYVGAAGRSTIDISCGKMTAIYNFLHVDTLSKKRIEKICDILDNPAKYAEEIEMSQLTELEEEKERLQPLAKKHVYYFGDEFYTWLINGKPFLHGNDQLIAAQNEINTIAVNSLIPKKGILTGPAKGAHWIGRTPQALLEFLEEILLEPEQ